MGTTVSVAQIVIAVSVLFVWIVRFTNVEKEFHEYALPNVVRNFVGASKISASALLLAGLWYPGLVFPAALTMTAFMVCAQYFHFRVRHPASKYAASFGLLVLSAFVAFSSRGSVA